MQIVFDFIAGSMPFKEFWEIYQSTPEIRQWLDQIADFNRDLPPEIASDLMLRGIYRTVQYDHQGHILPMLNDDYDTAKKKISDAIYQYCFFSVVETAVVSAFPKVKRTRRYKQNHTYYSKAMGRSIGGSEVVDYAANILAEFPETMKMADRVTAGKEALWSAFHIKDRKFPRWPQGADWPMGKNSPMEYLSQRQDGELVELRFRDVDTGEIRIVEQFY